MTILVADIGATNTRCALGTADAVGTVGTFLNRDFPGPDALLGQYLRALPGPARPAAAALAVAAPIRGDAVEMLNISWRFSVVELQRTLGLTSLRVLNDFAALAWALPALGPEELTPIGRGEVAPRYPMAVLGPGTGLGVAALVPADGTWRAIAGEGGHVTLPACDETEERVIGLARQRFGHCSAERILSGPGLTFLHVALHGGAELEAAEIGERARQGDAQARETLNRFFAVLGTVAGNLALTLGAFGGVYIGGGIAPRYVEICRDSPFRERFEGKGRYREYLGGIRTSVIMAPHATLTGLLAHAAAQVPSGS